ncbi:MAG TPA: DUF3800 domain-containing protein [Stellaceae bacterium]|nr:DUF3800 domain-containing protein [Stellaceae bacterium]
MAVGFVAYIDEAGDDGIKRVRPAHPDGASEWLILSCVVLSVENDKEVLPWVKEIVSKFRNPQRKDIHFKDLHTARKRIVCKSLAEKPVRLFVVMSNKKNLPAYINPRLNDNRRWLYWWLSRCLLERVTEFCDRKSMVLYKEKRTVKIIFSNRGGMSYPHFRDYISLLREQNSNGSMYNSTRNIHWDYIDVEEIYAKPHKTLAGLQLADTVASAFYQAVALNDKGGCDPQFAKMLKGRMYRSKAGRYLGAGIKPMPQPKQMDLEKIQREIFEFYGYDRQKW